MKTSLIIIAIASSLFAKSQVTYHTPAGKDSSIEEKFMATKNPTSKPKHFLNLKEKLLSLKKYFLKN